ncbi:MAG: M81 family metallopeptidase [Planctomycetaceae bacterium]|nr:M81 family metallopeptidase [Planctomycetaceae bacterium]
MRIGIIALLHESNTFSHQPTTLESFRQSLLLSGEPIRAALANAHHEVGGFFAGLEESGVESAPIFAARALPSGPITAETFDCLQQQMLTTLEAAGTLDGLLVAPHGATVSENLPDADGRWLSILRSAVGPSVPMIGTLDAHANLSPQMVAACDALVAYRTNPHLDQRARGIDAARLMVRTVRGEIRPTMSAVMPPLAISIDRQCTDEPHLQPLYEAADAQLSQPGVLSNSILLGFPYADVAEMGSAVIVVTDGDRDLARKLSRELAEAMWEMRDRFVGEFISAEEALDRCLTMNGPICLLDMGDNVGGGSAADGTELLGAIHHQQISPSFGCVYDPEAVTACERAGPEARIRLQVGGKTDRLHGDPLDIEATVQSLHDGRFDEQRPRHGGITEFDQGRTAIVTTDAGLTLMLTSLRMVPFSLSQLTSFGLNPARFRVLVAKGVNAPIAAYREVCREFIRVNTGGSTCADMTRLPYHCRRRPLFPLERDATFTDELRS